MIEVELAFRRDTRTRRVLEKRSIGQSTERWLVTHWHRNTDIRKNVVCGINSSAVNKKQQPFSSTNSHTSKYTYIKDPVYTISYTGTLIRTKRAPRKAGLDLRESKTFESAIPKLVVEP